MERKGQVAFESLFLTLVVISAGIFITSLYMTTHDGTVALFTAKTEIMNQINSSSKEVTLENLEINAGTKGDMNLIIKTNPPIALDLILIKNKIINSTKYKDVNIYLN